jgi:hypothetical protein
MLQHLSPFCQLLLLLLLLLLMLLLCSDCGLHALPLAAAEDAAGGETCWQHYSLDWQQQLIICRRLASRFRMHDDAAGGARV